MKHDEWQLQCDAVKLLRENLWVVFHIPNERNSGVADSMRMKAGGVVKGAPDLVCWSPINCRCYWLELKTPKGKRSLEQECMEDLANVLGIRYVLVRSLEDVEKIL